MGRAPWIRAALCATVGATLCAAATEAVKDFDIVLYGATGCVGGIAARHLAKQEKLRWAVAGRNAAEVKSLVDELSNAPETSSKPEQIVAPLDPAHPESAAWVQRTRVVATAAGPYSVHDGEVLVKACAENGVHYVDTSDEFYWQRDMIDKYDGVAHSTGARLVLSGGFCALAGDLGAQLAIEAAARDEGQGMSGPEGVPRSSDAGARVDSWLEVYNGGVSAGVINTEKALKNASFPKEWATDPYVLAPSIAEFLKVDTSVTGLGKLAWDKHEGAVTQNIFGPYDARLLRRSFATLGQAVHYRSGAPPSMYAKWAAFLAMHPRSWSSLTTCPTPAILRDGSWRMRVRATEYWESEGSRSATVVLSGTGDPGYAFTAAGLAEVGLCLAGRVEGCLRVPAARGVLTPMGAMAPDGMRKRLEAAGMLRVEVAEQEDAQEAAAIVM